MEWIYLRWILKGFTMKRSKTIDRTKYNREAKMFGIVNLQKVVDELKVQERILKHNAKLERDYKKFGREVI